MAVSIPKSVETIVRNDQKHSRKFVCFFFFALYLCSDLENLGHSMRVKDTRKSAAVRNERKLLSKIANNLFRSTESSISVSIRFDSSPLNKYVSNFHSFRFLFYFWHFLATGIYIIFFFFFSFRFWFEFSLVLSVSFSICRLASMTNTWWFMLPWSSHLIEIFQHLCWRQIAFYRLTEYLSDILLFHFRLFFFCVSLTICWSLSHYFSSFFFSSLVLNR